MTPPTADAASLSFFDLSDDALPVEPVAAPTPKAEAAAEHEFAFDAKAVMKRIRTGHPEAFREIVQAYGGSLRSYLGAHMHYLDDVDDLAQEVFIAAFRNIATFDVDKDLGAWLRGIARYKLYNYFRSTSRRSGAMGRFQVEVTRSVHGDVEETANRDRIERIEALRRCIDKLPPRMQRVVRAGLEGDKPAKLAEALNTSVGAIYNLHYRANQMLRDLLRRELANE